MKSLLKIAISALALGMLASTPLIRAQAELTPMAKGGKGKGMPTADAMVTRLDDAVTLTDDQKSKAKDIYAKMISDTQALAPEDRATKGGEIRDAANKDIRALLTPDQQTKFDAMPPMGGRGGKKKKGN